MTKTPISMTTFWNPFMYCTILRSFCISQKYFQSKNIKFNGIGVYSIFRYLCVRPSICQLYVRYLLSLSAIIIMFFPYQSCFDWGRFDHCKYNTFIDSCDANFLQNYFKKATAKPLCQAKNTPRTTACQPALCLHWHHQSLSCCNIVLNDLPTHKLGVDKMCEQFYLGFY